MTAKLGLIRRGFQSFFSERSLHVCVLCAFAFSQPLFSSLTQQFVYLHDLEAGWIEIGYVVLLLSVIVPLVWVALDILVIAASARVRGRGRNLVLTILMSLIWLSFLRPIMGFEYLKLQASVWLVTLILAAVGALLSIQAYLRSVWIRRWVSVATIGLFCFPGLFLYQYSCLKKSHQAARATRVNAPAPVIMVVFDEFSGTTLMNRDLQIDDRNFPQFARLAKMSTWYRQGSTVHNRTDVAVPALLSGQFPTFKRPALDSEYPGNLFRVIHSSDAYNMVVFEPVTRLCPKSVKEQKKVSRSFYRKISLLTETLATVYPHLVFPNDIPITFPPVSRLWFGLPEFPENGQTPTTGLFSTNPFFHRDGQLDQFLENLKVTEKPLFGFFHVELPHLPWCFLPSGANYNFDDSHTFEPAGSWGDIGEDWRSDSAIVARNEYRYLQQVRFVDVFVGRLLDHLQEIGLLDSCLLIVTADHGVSFRPNHSRRSPDSENLPDVLSIPLFIKLPRQITGRLDDRNVESVDVLPTIAEVLGMVLPEPVDGVSVTQEVRRNRKTLYFDKGMTILEPFIPHLKSAVNRRLDTIGTDYLDRLPPRISSRAEWHGRSTSEFTIEDRQRLDLKIAPPVSGREWAVGKFVPCLVRGSFDIREFSESSADLVLAVNNVIYDSSRSFPGRHGRHEFEFLLPEATALARPCRVELFHVEQTASDQARLQRLGSWDWPEAR